MADTKVSAMTENTDPQPGDLLYLSDGGAADKKIALSTLGHLTIGAEQTPTSGDPTATTGEIAIVDMSGITADRDFVLPAGAAVGEHCGIYVSAGLVTGTLYELDIHCATGDTIDGIDRTTATGTAQTRLFITGEYLEWVMIAANKWATVRDGRIPCFGRCYLSGDTTSSITGGVQENWQTFDDGLTLIDADHIGGCMATTGTFTTRRRCAVTCTCRLQMVTSQTSYWQLFVAGGYVNMNTTSIAMRYTYTTAFDRASGDSCILQVKPGTTTKIAGGASSTWFAVQEVPWWES